MESIVKVYCSSEMKFHSHYRGFGYLEFSNAQSAAEAISGMNMFDLGGQYLRVGKCITPPDALTYIVPTSAVNLPTAAAVAAAEVTAKIQAEEMTTKKSPAIGASTLIKSPSVSVFFISELSAVSVTERYEVKLRLIVFFKTYFCVLQHNNIE